MKMFSELHTFEYDFLWRRVRRSEAESRNSQRAAAQLDGPIVGISRAEINTSVPAINTTVIAMLVYGREGTSCNLARSDSGSFPSLLAIRPDRWQVPFPFAVRLSQHLRLPQQPSYAKSALVQLRSDRSRILAQPFRAPVGSLRPFN